MKLFELKELGTYSAVLPTAGTLALIKAWAAENKIQLDSGLHVTVLYSRTCQLVPEPKQFKYKAVPLSLGPLGTAALVLKLFSPELSARHAEIIEAGHTHDFETFTPHITFVSKGQLPTSMLPFPQVELTFDQEYTTPLSE